MVVTQTIPEEYSDNSKKQDIILGVTCVLVFAKVHCLKCMLEEKHFFFETER